MSSHRIAIRTPNWLGDLMMSTAFINEVLKQHPESQVDLVVKQGFETMPLPRRGDIIPFDKQSVSAFSFGRQLRDRQYQQFYVLPPSFSSALMAFASRATDRIGYAGNLRSLLLNQKKQYSLKHRDQHLVKEYLQLLPDWNPESPIQPGLIIDQKWVEITLADGFQHLPSSFVCVAPGVIYGSAKQWPPEYFKSLVSKLEAEGHQVVVIGTENDRPLGELLSEGVSNVLNLCGKTSLNQLIALLAKSKVLISNDSGTMHIMAALQKPQIAIFGSTSTIWTGPVNNNAVVIRLDMDCSPCFKRECPLGHTNCLKQISPDLVWDKLSPLL